METMGVNPKEIVFALDIGTRSIIGTVGVIREKKFYILAEHYVEHEERAMIDGQIHDISLVAAAVQKVKKQLEEAMGFHLENVAIAAAGRFLRTAEVKAELEIDEEVEVDKETIRRLEMAAVKMAEERVHKQTEGKLYCVGYSVKSYYLNGYVIGNLLSHKGENVAIEVIATFLPRSVVDSLYAVMEKVKLKVVSLTLEPIAAIEAAIPKNLRLLNLALIDVGAGTSDIAISSKESICAYGMVPMAGDEVTEMIAQTYLVDFNKAEHIKRECQIRDKISYVDVLGLENEVDSQEILKVVTPIVGKIAEEVGGKIIELNGGKAPNAVFLVGGGAHTPMLKEMLADKLGLPVQRLAIKGREAVVDCENANRELGSMGVTVLGIALISIKRRGSDFIDIILNDNVVSLFNAQKHTVMDVLVQAGIHSKSLMGKNGKNIHFLLNGTKRVAFGTMAVNASITVNGTLANLDADVKEGDKLELVFARDGKDAAPKVYEFLQQINAVSFYLNGQIINIEPVVHINGAKVNLQHTIIDGDNVEVVYPRNLGDFCRYSDQPQRLQYYKDDVLLDTSYSIQEGDKITSKSLEVQSSIQNKDTKKVLKVCVNGTWITLIDKEKYIFVDIFNFIDFDLTKAKGSLHLLLNGKNAKYYDVLNEGDEIEVGWR